MSIQGDQGNHSWWLIAKHRNSYKVKISMFDSNKFDNKKFVMVVKNHIWTDMIQHKEIPI